MAGHFNPKFIYLNPVRLNGIHLCFHIFRLMSRRDFQGELEYGILWLTEIQASIECDKPLKLDTQNVQEEMKKLQVRLSLDRNASEESVVIFHII